MNWKVTLLTLGLAAPAAAGSGPVAPLDTSHLKLPSADRSLLRKEVASAEAARQALAAKLEQASQKKVSWKGRLDLNTELKHDRPVPMSKLELAEFRPIFVPPGAPLKGELKAAGEAYAQKVAALRASLGSNPAHAAALKELDASLDAFLAAGDPQAASQALQASQAKLAELQSQLK